MIINFKVNGDTIKTSEKETFYTGNVNSYICEFEFSEDWDKAAAFCVMTNGKKSAVLYIADSKCTVPSEILSGKGTVKLGLYGTDGNKRISTNCVMLKVREGAYEIGEDDMTMPIPDVWEQLVSKTVPKIGDNGNWLVWSMTENKYVDTGIYATVDIGEFYKKSETDEKLSGKVDKVTGKGLSTNDYTDEEKEKLKGLSNYDDTEIKKEVGGKVDKVQGKGLSTNDYTTEEKTKLSELPSNTELDTDLSGKEDTANKVTTLDSNSTDTQYPSAKTTYDELVKKLNADEAVGKKTEQGGEVFNVESGNRAYGKSSHAQGKRCCTGILAFPIKQIDTSNNRIILDYNDVSTVIDSFKADTGIKLSLSDIFLSSAIYYGCTDIDTATNSRTYYTLGSYPSIYYVNSEDICILTFSYLEKNINPSYIYMDVNSFGTVPILGENSSAEGFGVIALSANQHAQGVYNEKDFANRYAHIVGNGTSSSKRSNAHTLDWDGNAWYQGDIRVGGTSYDDGKTVETKTTIVKSTETTANIALADNTEARYGEITSLTTTLSETISDSFISSVIFKSGATATAVTVPSGVYCQGADCKNGTFLPKVNKRYTMIFSYDGIMNCYIAAVPIQTAETQSVDDFPVTNDESVAEPTESVAEEPESEPNEVI